MDIQNLINEIIPPSDYTHRNGFTNESLIEQLNDSEKQQVEDALIEKLLANSQDTLIITTLAYLKSRKSLPVLYKILEKSTSEMAKIIIASSIFEINKDWEMSGIAVESFMKFTNKYQIISAFYYLALFNNSETNKVIEEYIRHPDYLVSYNAKRALGLLPKM